MEQITINLSANNQNLTVDNVLEITDDTVRYVHAVVDLGDNWEFDSIRAIWTNGISVPTVLNNGECDVPAEVLDHIGVVKVNLVGSDVENDELIDRLPTWQIPCILVKQDVPIDGTDPKPVTPSQFEQFVQAVKDDADRAEQAESNAQGYASDSQGYAQNASESATSAHDDKIAIEQAIAEVIQQIEDFEQVQVVVNTLPPSSQATSDFTDGVLTLGIPQGVKGDTGNGIQSIAKTGTSGLADTYTITYTDGQTTTFTVTNGAKGDTGNGVQSIAKTSTVGLVDTYTITYTNGTTTTFTVTNGEKGEKGDTGEVSLATLESLMPTDTASGSIASFPDGQAVFGAKSVVVDLEPIQDLHGYDKPWSGGAGVNVLDPNIKFPSGNQFGLTVTTDGYHYKFVGTATSSGTFETNAINSADAIILPAGEYYLKSGRADLRKPNGTPIVNQWAGAFTMTEPFYVRNIYWTITSGQTYDSENFIALVKGSTAPTSWTPYSNICPIYGRTEVVTQRTGKNLIPNPFPSRTTNGVTFTVNDDGSVSLSGTATATAWFHGIASASDKRYIKAGTYRMQGGISNNIMLYIIGEYIDGTGISNSSVTGGVYDTGNGLTFTLKNDAYIAYQIQVNNGTNVDGKVVHPQIELGSTATSYEPYQGHTYTTQFGQTVYGGSVDVVSGVLTVDRAMVDLGTLDWIYTTNLTYPFMRTNGIASVVKRPNKSSDKVNIISSALDSMSAYDISTMGYYGIAIHTDGAIRCATSNMGTDPTAFKTAMSGVQLCYELAQPQTYQLTPTEVQTLLGDNNIWSDSGDIAVVYVADIQRYIDKKLS